ncbi:disintegrin and metalloproteinase domain-containing protein 19 [Hemiscyllium ocellatum]|uniref:disintegrin and metalloproteinase domain-containing protein 19 n=1 Tax=Hemiscyllium ocellatum TaxID=170820 RepID=UPI002966EDAE|nr:disintegrin and metalloproteinase domain-containing protein 19 [Hemiscyllium ocellatum]
MAQSQGPTPSPSPHLAQILCCLVLAGCGEAGGRSNKLNPEYQMHNHIIKYETIVPQWLTSGPLEHPPSQNQHPAWAEIQVTAEGRHYILEIQKNEQLMALGYAETHYSPTGEQRTSYPDHKSHCLYHGNVKGFKHSSVVLSTCRGLRGLIILNMNLSYMVQPLEDSLDHHLIYRTEHLKLKGGTCGHQESKREENWVKDFTRQFHPEHHRVKRDVVKDMKYVELYVVADYAEFQKHNWDLEKTKLKLKETVNYVDKYYRSLNIRIALVHLEVWTHENKCDVREDPYITLWSFLKWRRQILIRKKHDNAQLITGTSFNGTTIGFAPLMGMCSDYQSGGINMDHSDSAIGVAATMAHEMGHNFGMSHDADGCCAARPEDGGCIMAAATGDPFPKVFNKCNEKELQKYLNNGGGMCLFNMPDTNTLYGGRRCGNGYVEEGEQCDCGEVEECNNPCCHANNCTLKRDAECAHGICCEKCKLKASGTVCRASSGPCDLPEYCSGSSEFCPANFYKMDGASCDGGQAYCYNGMCLTYDSQCVLLWGAGAQAAPAECFKMVNSAGDTYGNCGRGPGGSYRKCETRNAKCGKIQCQSAAQKPLDANAVAIDTTIILEGRKVQCRGTHVYMTPELEGDMLDPGLVMTGTKCTEKHICFEGQCQNASFLQADECIAKCHNHGVCNNKHNCHCEAGWAPPFCNKPGYGGSVDGGVGAPGYNSLIVVGIVMPIILLLCGIAVTLHYCYRRRNNISPKDIKNLGPDDKQFCDNNVDQKIKNGHSNPTFQIRNKDTKSGQQQSPALPQKPVLPHSFHSQRPVLILPSLRPTSPTSNDQQDSIVPTPIAVRVQSPASLEYANIKPLKQTPPNRPLPADPLPKTSKVLQRVAVLNSSPNLQINNRTVQEKLQDNMAHFEPKPYKRDHIQPVPQKLRR